MPDEVAHQESQIEGAAMHQESLPNVVVAAQMCASHRTGVIKMGKRLFDAFPAPPHEALAARAADPPPIRVGRLLRVRQPSPRASTVRRFGDV